MSSKAESELVHGNNECVLITASSKGLGKAIAEIFAENKYDIILHGRNEEKAKKTEEELLGRGIRVYTVLGDLRENETLDALYAEARDRNASVLVNNAAIPCCGKPLEELDDEYILENLEVNLIAPIKLTKKIYSLFLDRGSGTIININSIVGLEPKKFRSVHSASKWGLRGFSNSLRIEAKTRNIQVMEVYPTRIKTAAEFTYGMEPREVAQKIYDAYKSKGLDELVIDGRPPEFRGK